MMKHLLTYLFLLLALSPCAYAAQIEAFVQSYYEAEITIGDCSADYLQTNNLKSHLTAGNSLELRLYDLPEGTLQRSRGAFVRGLSSPAVRRQTRPGKRRS